MFVEHSLTDNFAENFKTTAYVIHKLYIMK